MGYSAVKLTEPSETDMDTDLLALTTKKSDTNMNKTKINSPDIWIEDSVRGNTEVDKFIQTIIALTKEDLPKTRVKHWSQWFQEGYVGDIKMPRGGKSNVYLDDIVIYSEGETGGSLSHMTQPLHHYVQGVDGHWYPKKRTLNPHSPEVKKGLVGTQDLTGTWCTTVWARFQRKLPADNKQEDSPSRLKEIKRMLSDWSRNLRTTIVCLTAITAIALILAHLSPQEVFQAKNSEQSCPGWHQHQQMQTSRNWTKQVQEVGMSAQKETGRKGKLLKEKEQAATGNPTITSRENRRVEKRERKLERNLLFMIASGTVCQAVSHTGYGWCVHC